MDLYVRPGDLRLAEPGAPGIDVRVHSVQRTGPLVRAGVETIATGAEITVELPHLHHDAPSFKPGAELRLRMMQFSIYPREGHEARQKPAVAGLTPVGEHRERGRA